MQPMVITPKDLVSARLYANEAAVVREAMQYLFQNRPDVRIDFAVYRYENDPDLSLAKAAALAGVSFERMKDIISSKGIPLRLGPETLEEAKAEVEVMEHWFHERLD